MVRTTWGTPWDGRPVTGTTRTPWLLARSRAAQVRGVISFFPLSSVPSRSKASSLIDVPMAIASCVVDGSIVAPFAGEKKIDGGGILC